MTRLSAVFEHRGSCIFKDSSRRNRDLPLCLLRQCVDGAQAKAGFIAEIVETAEVLIWSACLSNHHGAVDSADGEDVLRLLTSLVYSALKRFCFAFSATLR
jgi:hypothetical protein